MSRVRGLGENKDTSLFHKPMLGVSGCSTPI